MHWPVPLNPNGNHPIIPKLPDGTRDVDHSWDIRDTWKQMEALVKKGMVINHHMRIPRKIERRQGQKHWSQQLFPSQDRAYPDKS